ncbi:hypothetical protein P3X46_030504 [Hevea brasiliensis]|uniref:SAM domain-containing protein n=1 Tax=Hevea brasiliensis TaxID=3981 RepID=A0ABQ9KHJ7_HEVBR|nr:uncharacterized protein LOC110644095 [Hevea brasiliensis]KAJ9139806.1 hypothetical protein P3X46_030504 [Hevea brasiliensis]
MSTISTSIFASTHFLCSTNSSSSSRFSLLPSSCPSSFSRYPSCFHHLCHFRRKTLTVVFSKSSEAEEELSSVEDEWLKRLPDKKKPLYSHSLPCIEAWLRDIGFYQTKDDRAVWLIEQPEWHAQLSLDITDLYIRYLKSGPGNLEKDVERRFSYALSREDIENAILGGP